MENINENNDVMRNDKPFVSLNSEIIFVPNLRNLKALVLFA